MTGNPAQHTAALINKVFIDQRVRILRMEQRGDDEKEDWKEGLVEPAEISLRGWLNEACKVWVCRETECVPHQCSPQCVHVQGI